MARMISIGSGTHGAVAHARSQRQTHRIGKDLLRLECVDGEHGQIADEQEGDNLSTGLAAIVLWQVDATARYIVDEQ